MISNAYDDLILEAASAENVPFEWIKAIIGAESDFNPLAYRAEPQIGDASYGLMQLLTRTARGLGFDGAPEDLYDPATNISLGAKLLGQLVARFGMDFQAVYSAYNSGSGTSYLTNSAVASHVARAVRYLQDVVSGAAGETGSAGLGTTETGLLVGAGLLAALLLRG